LKSNAVLVVDVGPRDPRDRRCAHFPRPLPGRKGASSKPRLPVVLCGASSCGFPVPQTLTSPGFVLTKRLSRDNKLPTPLRSKIELICPCPAARLSMSRASSLPPLCRKCGEAICGMEWPESFGFVHAQSCAHAVFPAGRSRSGSMLPYSNPMLPSPAPAPIAFGLRPPSRR